MGSLKTARRYPTMRVFGVLLIVVLLIVAIVFALWRRREPPARRHEDSAAEPAPAASMEARSTKVASPVAGPATLPATVEVMVLLVSVFVALTAPEPGVVVTPLPPLIVAVADSELLIWAARLPIAAPAAVFGAVTLPGAVVKS